MHIIENTLSAAVVPLAGVVGLKVTNFIADASTDQIPSWAAPLIGPLGALVGTVLAIRWLLKRLDKAEAKSEKREEERDKNLTLIAAMTVQNQTIIEQNSEVLAEVKKAIEGKQ